MRERSEKKKTGRGTWKRKRELDENKGKGRAESNDELEDKKRTQKCVERWHATRDMQAGLTGECAVLQKMVQHNAHFRYDKRGEHPCLSCRGEARMHLSLYETFERGEVDVSANLDGKYMSGCVCESVKNKMTME